MKLSILGLGLSLLGLSHALPRDKRQDAPPANADDDVDTLATWLSISKCGGLFDPRASQIRAGWRDSWLMMNEVAGGVNWNEAAALEYLGAPSTLGTYKDRVEEIVKQIATLQPGWVGTPLDWTLNARCDDPEKICPCLSNSRTYAYVHNDFDNESKTYINFCPLYFDAPLLKDKVTEMKDRPDSDDAKWNMNTYHGTKGHIWFHELSHWSRGTRRDIFTIVTDWWIEYIPFKFGQAPRVISTKVYGGLSTKLLARWNASPGQYLWRSADNLAMYANAKYVQKILGRYPDLPILPLGTLPKGSPLPDDPTVPFVADGDDNLITANDMSGSGDAMFSDAQACTGEAGASTVLRIDSLADKSAYPDDYVANLEKRIAELGGKSGDDGTSNTGDWIPLPDDIQLSCGGSDLSANFPSSWKTLDGDASAGDLLYRMRDQACQNKCETISGVPGSPGNPSPDGFFASAKHGASGCEYSVKIGSDRELYFYTTNDGQSCYDATEKLINTCVNEQRKDAGWINGPNYGEFYQVGVRTVGDDQWDLLENWPQDQHNHLGYKQVACQRTDNGKSDLWYEFKVEINNWDDGNWGRSIRDGAKKCGLTTEWKYEDEHDYVFNDGTKAEKWASFRLPYLISDRCGERAIESALGLARDSLTCKRGEWNEISTF